MKMTKLKKTFNDWKWAMILLAFCIAGIPLTIIYGIQSVNWGNDFWPNALSEFLGMFVELIFGAIFTFVVIDKYTQFHKNKQWKKIKSITYKNLYFIFSNLVLKLNHSLPKEMRVESYVLTEDIETLNDYLPKEDFDIIVKSLITGFNAKIEEKYQCNDLAKIPNSSSASFPDEALYNSLLKFKQHSKADISTLSSMTIPKLLNFSDDILLLDYLIEIEELFVSLMPKIKTLHLKNINPVGEVKCIWLFKFEELLSKISTVCDLILDDVDFE